MNMIGQTRLHDDAPVDEADEQLVAYLDGELPPEEVKALEQRLGADAALRARLRDLQNGWELLDQLPLASSSSALLETTIRMAAVQSRDPANKSLLRKPLTGARKIVFIFAACLACFVVGAGITRAREYWQYRKQLRDLPVAMHLDAFLRATDLELMQTLNSMPQWQQANEVADRLGEWDFSLAQQIDEASPRDREKLLPTLPIEDRQLVAAAWERFERIEPTKKEAIYQAAEKVAKRPDGAKLLQTMDRFAVWQESLPADERDKLAKGTEQQRQEVIMVALERTTKQWTRQRGRDLSDEEVETIYHAVRQIARLRLKSIHRTAPPEIRDMIGNFGSSNQSVNPMIEAGFLRRLFEPRESSLPGPPSNFGAPPMMPGIDFAMITKLRNVAESIRGPLQDNELYMIEAVLPQKLADDINATAGMPALREELLRSLADESLRRTQWNRSGKTLIERYQTRDPGDREEIDLLPADRMLRELRDDFRR
jgi:hypothetical protein